MAQNDLTHVNQLSVPVLKYDLTLLVHVSHNIQRVKAMQDHSTVVKILLTFIIFADVVSRSSAGKKRECCRALPHCSLTGEYIYCGRFDLSDISSSEYNQAFGEHQPMKSKCSY